MIMMYVMGKYPFHKKILCRYQFDEIFEIIEEDLKYNSYSL